MKLLALIVAVALTGVQAVKAQSTSIQLDGKKYKIELTKEGSKDAAIVQTILFENGMFQTPGFTSFGFKESKAYAKPTADYFTWMSTVNSEKEGAMGWQGKVTGEKIDGTCVWRKPNAQPIQYNFQGTEIKSEIK
ncbi:MAG: hypothetical protein IPO83_05070 [Chitinophagaceae bacterium]|nr:hypothetical protein [Chitinophagaceae bacterium]